ncbi:MAG TPA: hypothetical protein VF026_00220, partial [Ktedonobacteraceae bacterium]
GLVPGGEPIEEQVQAHLPLLLLQLHPLVKRSFLTQPEAVEEGAANEREGVLGLGDQRGAQLLGGQRGQPLDLAVGVLHHGEVQLEGGLRVQAKQFRRREQMGEPSRRGVGVSEQGAQQRQGVAQGRASIMGLTVGPQQGGELDAGMHAAFDGQVEQQGLRLAQGKREAAVVMKDFGSAEHGKT